MTQVVTPQQIESRLYQLSKEVDTAHQELVSCEMSYHTAVAEYEIGLAKSRLELAGRNRLQTQVKIAQSMSASVRASMDMS